MFKVNNKAAISRLAINSFKANRIRNLIAVLAIALTCILFTSVGTISMSVIDTLQHSYLRQVGTTLQAGYKGITLDMAQRLQQDAEVSDVAMRIYLGTAENEELLKSYTEISYIDELYLDTSFYPFIDGGMPVMPGEVAVTDSVLNALGLPLEIGQSITIDYTANGEKQSDEFVVAGITELDKALPAGQIFVTRDYLESVVPVWQGENNEQYISQSSDKGSTYLAGSVAVNFNLNGMGSIEQQVSELTARLGFDDGYIDTGVNWGYVSGNLDIGSILLISALILLITFSGYLIIYNVFLISVGGDIKFYGLLKTIGTTSRQLKRIIYRQAVMLFIIGTPIGLLIGYILASTLFPVIIASSTLENFVVSQNPLIFIASSFFTFVTVIISCQRPARFVAKLSPIEAVRHTEHSTIRRKRRRTAKVTPFSMAMANIGRSKLKSTMVIISLTLSVLIFNVIYTFVSGFDLDDYISRSAVSDFLVSDADLINLNFGEDRDTGITQDVITAVSQQPGIEDIGLVYYYGGLTHTLSTTARQAALTEFGSYIDDNNYGEQFEAAYLQAEQTGEIGAGIYGVSDNLFEHIDTESINYTTSKNTLSEEQKQQFLSGDYLLTFDLYALGDTFYKPGEKAVVDFGNGNSKEYEVISVGDLPYPIDKRYTTVAEIYFILPETEFLKQLAGHPPMTMTINTEPQYTAELEEFLQSYTTAVNKNLDYESKALFEQAFYDMKNTFLASGITLSVILGLIGIFNLINTMITGINARRIELAMLQSMGLTGRQLKSMIIFEGLFYGALVITILITAGSVITYFVVGALSQVMVTSSYQFLPLPVLSCAAVLLAVSIITPLLIYRRLQKQSIIERLREAV